MKEFNISGKLRLQDTATVIIDGRPICKKVSAWIREAPDKLWMAIREQHVGLVRNAHHALKMAIYDKHPDLYHQNLAKQRQRAARKNVLAKLRA